jgi:hypothetical protein
LDIRQKNYRRAVQELMAFDLEIRKAGAIWDMAQAAISMNQAAGMTEDDFLAKISRETAIDSVTTNLNSAIADLETSLLDEPELPKLTDTQTPITMGAVRNKEAIGQ